MARTTRRTVAGARGTLLMAAMLLAGTMAVGQSPSADMPPETQAPPPPRRVASPEEQLSRLTRLLNLTADQQKGVRMVLEQQAAEIKALREKAPADPATGQTPDSEAEQRTQMQQIREESDSKILALLDEGQKNIYAGWVKKRNERRERRRGDEPGDGAPPPQN